MKAFVSFLCLSGLCSSLLALSPPVFSENHSFVPLRALLVSNPTQAPVWIEGTVLSQEEDDLYIIEDSTAKIHLFLCLDELLQYTLLPGDRIVAWGKVDVNSVGRNKNEFYAEKLYCREDH